MSFEDVSDEELLLAYKAHFEEDPIRLVTSGKLSIKTKDSRLIKLNPNKCQKALIETIVKLIRQNKPVRIWVLKARQEGISTGIGGIAYSYTSQKENINCLLMADELDHSDNIFEMCKLYQEELEKDYSFLAPELKRSNAKELSFEEIRSKIVIATAKDKQAARSSTFQIVHLSEVAFFDNFKDIMYALAQSVPNLPGTMIFGETTANGVNEFYDEWVRAKNGVSDWTALFIPWYWMDEYRVPLQDGELYPLEGIHFTKGFTAEDFINEEEKLRRTLGLDEEQINYRRWAIVNNCQGEIIKFRQEMPATDEEAFQVSGIQFFDAEGLKEQESKIQAPIATGEIFEVQGEYEFRNMQGGRIEIFEHPDPSKTYLLTADASEAVGADEASIYVGNVHTNETVAIVAGQYQPEELAHMIVMLGNYYNKCMVAPENKSYGYMVCQQVFKTYGNIYRNTKTAKGSLEQTQELGFNTNTTSRPEMLAIAAEEVRLNTVILKSKRIISQYWTFVINPDTFKAEAVQGKQDGLVICKAIFSLLRSRGVVKHIDRDDLNYQRELAIDRARKARYSTMRRSA